MRAVDTNVLVRLLARDDPKQVAAAEAFVQTGAQPGAWVSHLVLMEAVWVLDTVYDVNPAQIALGVDMLLDHEDLVATGRQWWITTALLGLALALPGMGYCLRRRSRIRAGRPADPTEGMLTRHRDAAG